MSLKLPCISRSIEFSDTYEGPKQKEVSPFWELDDKCLSQLTTPFNQISNSYIRQIIAGDIFVTLFSIHKGRDL